MIEVTKARLFPICANIPACLLLLFAELDSKMTDSLSAEYLNEHANKSSARKFMLPVFFFQA